MKMSSSRGPRKQKIKTFFIMENQPNNWSHVQRWLSTMGSQEVPLVTSLARRSFTIKSLETKLNSFYKNLDDDERT